LRNISFAGFDQFLDLFRQCHIGSVARSCRQDLRLDRTSYQCKISYQIQQLVTRHFIGIMQIYIVQDTLRFVDTDLWFVQKLRQMIQLSILYLSVYDHDRVRKVTAFDQVLLVQALPARAGIQMSGILRYHP
jgi:hypothetical protein